MSSFQQHLRDTFLAGVFAGVPIVVTVIIIIWIDGQTQVLARLIFGRSVPMLGIAVAIVCIYWIGLIVRSLLGRQILALLDALLRRVPLVRPIYEAWKQVSLTPGDKGGMFARVVLVPVETGRIRVLGFTSGEGLPGNPDVCAVFLPNSPNPITGRLFFVPRADLTFLSITPEEGLKLIISTGNYAPPSLAGALQQP